MNGPFDPQTVMDYGHLLYKIYLTRGTPALNGPQTGPDVLCPPEHQVVFFVQLEQESEITFPVHQ